MKKDRKNIIIALEFLVIILLLGYITMGNQLNKYSTQAQANEATQQITEAARTCMQLPVEERDNCARDAGVRIHELFGSTEERYRECMKFRPLLVRECQEGIESQ